MPDLTIIIISHNNRNALGRAIVSARRFAGTLQCETLVVDNASTDGSAQMVQRLYSNVQLIANQSHRGYSNAVNQALAVAGGHLVLLLDLQAELTAGCLETLVAVMDAHPHVGACGPELEPSAAFRAGAFPTLALSLLPEHRRRQREATQLQRRARERDCYDVDWLPGTCLLVRREAIQQIGGPDPRLRPRHAEMDWCWRLKRAQWRRVLVPGALCRLGGTQSEPHNAAVELRDEYTYWRLNRGWLPTWLLYQGRLLQAGSRWSALVVSNLLARNRDTETKGELRYAAGNLGWHVRNGLKVLLGKPGR